MESELERQVTKFERDAEELIKSAIKVSQNIESRVEYPHQSINATTQQAIISLDSLAKCLVLLLRHESGLFSNETLNP